MSEEIVRRGYGIVYGGGHVGLMGTVAERAMQLGGEVIGVIPRTLTEREVAFEGVTRLHVVGSMHERKAMMNQLSSAFVTLPGGYGTLEELFEVVTWAMLGIHEKPVGLLDVGGYFSPLLSFLDHASAQGFIRAPYREMLKAHDEPAALLDVLEKWEPPRPIQWLDLDET